MLYLVFGSLTTLINMLVYFILTRLFHRHYLFANAAAWMLAVAFAYATNKKYVFKSGSNKKVGRLLEVTGFFVFRAISGMLDMLFMFLLISVAHIHDTISKVFVNVLVVVLNYLFSKYIIFKKE